MTIVHRGDGIFEAFSSVLRDIFIILTLTYRLENSARLISLNLPFDLETIKRSHFKNGSYCRSERLQNTHLCFGLEMHLVVAR